ncbi:DUF6427 family protein [Sphingobacterium sp. SYP-B4668]|uniref:DUF6427 family protein n=1 Tax=Sphingobacterium sp. SYP-B4668 TaxID=2996035 RepID=UPI0022DDDE85|nr:DUF6427 family protein [Sphingobacterium sp. SYP-B4668]
MIINQFRKFTPINIGLLALIGLALCLGVFLHLPNELTPILFEPALNNLLGLQSGLSLAPQSNVITTLGLTILQAFLLNKVMNDFNFLGKPSFLTALMYMTLASLFIPFLVLSPTLICNFISILMLRKLLTIYHQQDIKSLMFDLGMIVGIGSLIYFPFIVMFFLLWISLIIFRPFSWREWIATLLGLCTIYFMLAVIYYWLDRMEEFFNIFKPFTYNFPTALSMDFHDYLVLIPIFIALVLFLLILKDQFFKSIVHVRKSFQLLFFMLLLAIGSFYLNPIITESHFLLCAPPITVYLAYYFTYAKNKWIYESMYALIILTIIYFQFM